MIQGGTFPYVEYLNIHANISQDPCVDPDNATDAGSEDLVLNQDLVNSRLAEVGFPPKRLVQRSKGEVVFFLMDPCRSLIKSLCFYA